MPRNRLPLILKTTSGMNFEILKKDDDYSLLKLEENQVTPYAVVFGLQLSEKKKHKDDECIWDFGVYFSELSRSEEYFYDHVRLNQKNTTTENSDVQENKSMSYTDYLKLRNLSEQ